jgi:hypothetical protein
VGLSYPPPMSNLDFFFVCLFATGNKGDMGMKGDTGPMGSPGAQGGKGDAGKPGLPGKMLHCWATGLRALPFFSGSRASKS